jgi:hypothetical protein
LASGFIRLRKLLGIHKVFFHSFMMMMRKGRALRVRVCGGWAERRGYWEFIM